jgi:hypothetical protein
MDKVQKPSSPKEKASLSNHSELWYLYILMRHVADGWTAAAAKYFGIQMFFMEWYVSVYCEYK